MPHTSSLRSVISFHRLVLEMLHCRWDLKITTNSWSRKALKKEALVTPTYLQYECEGVKSSFITFLFDPFFPLIFDRYTGPALCQPALKSNSNHRPPCFLGQTPYLISRSLPDPTFGDHGLPHLIGKIGKRLSIDEGLRDSPQCLGGDSHRPHQFSACLRCRIQYFGCCVFEKRVRHCFGSRPVNFSQKPSAGRGVEILYMR